MTSEVVDLHMCTGAHHTPKTLEHIGKETFLWEGFNGQNVKQVRENSGDVIQAVMSYTDVT